MEESGVKAIPGLAYLSVPLKTTRAVDFSESFTQFILSHYGQDPASFTSAIQSLAQLRQLATAEIALESGTAARDALYKYHGQLELLELHFSPSLFEESGLVMFEWADAFHPESSTKQASLAFEKASVIFNLGAALSHLASTNGQQASNVESLKVGFNYFQVAANMFHFILENFLHPPTRDMSKRCCEALEALMLAQAQECFITKALLEAKSKPATLMKLAQQCAIMYAQITDMITTVSAASAADEQQLSKNYFPPVWIGMCKLKQKYFGALAQYYRSQVAGSESQFGEVVARMQLADQNAKEAVKLAKDLSSQSSSALSLFGLLKSPGGAGSASGGMDMTQLLTQITAFSSQVAQQLVTATRENDVIYHASIPASSTLPAPSALLVPKLTKLLELVPTLREIIGEDLFKDLIPLSVMETESVYTSKKDELVREVTRMVREADDTIDAEVRSLGVLETIWLLANSGVFSGSAADEGEKSSTALSSTSTSNTGSTPNEVKEWQKFIRSKGGTDSIHSLLQSISQLRSSTSLLIQQCQTILNTESNAYAADRQKYGDMIASKQPGPEQGLLSLREDLGRFEGDLEKGSKGDRAVLAKWTDIERVVGVYSSDATLRDFFNDPEKVLSSGASGTSPSASSTTASNQLVDLLSTPNEESEQSRLTKLIPPAEPLYKKCRDLLAQLTALKSDRSSLLSSLKSLVQTDSIHNLLVLTRKNESGVVHADMAKFEKERARVSESVRVGERWSRELSTAHGQLTQTELVRYLGSKQSRHKSAIDQLKQARVGFEEVLVNLESGRGFYSGLNANVQKLLGRCDQVCQGRRAERERILTKALAGNSSVGSSLGGESGAPTGDGIGRILQDRLAKLNVSSPPTSSTSPPSSMMTMPPVSSSMGVGVSSFGQGSAGMATSSMVQQAQYLPPSIASGPGPSSMTSPTMPGTFSNNTANYSSGGNNYNNGNNVGLGGSMSMGMGVMPTSPSGYAMPPPLSQPPPGTGYMNPQSYPPYAQQAAPPPPSSTYQNQQPGQQPMQGPGYAYPPQQQQVPFHHVPAQLGLPAHLQQPLGGLSSVGSGGGNQQQQQYGGGHGQQNQQYYRPPY